PTAPAPASDNSTRAATAPTGDNHTAGDHRRPRAETLVQWGLSKISHYGGRDNACWRLARQVLANGYDGAEGERIILDYWAACPVYTDDPFTQKDALRCWRSAH